VRACQWAHRHHEQDRTVHRHARHDGVFRALITYLTDGGTIPIDRSLREAYRPVYFSVRRHPDPDPDIGRRRGDRILHPLQDEIRAQMRGCRRQQDVARYSGISVIRPHHRLHRSGRLRAIAAICYVPRLGAATPTTGQLWELQVITAVVIGGTALRGGKGHVGDRRRRRHPELIANLMVLSDFVSEYLVAAVQGSSSSSPCSFSGFRIRNSSVSGTRGKVFVGPISGRRQCSVEMDRGGRASTLLGQTGHGTGQRVIAVSIPAADHGWTAGVVYRAQQAAKEINAAFPGVEVVVKTSPSAAGRSARLVVRQPPARCTGHPALQFGGTNPAGQAIKSAGTFITVVDRGLTDSSIRTFTSRAATSLWAQTLRCS
jgi:hypothetical protein